jgi:hypothetical protein
MPSPSPMAIHLLIAQDYEDLKYITKKLIDEYEMWVLKLDIK